MSKRSRFLLALSCGFAAVSPVIAAGSGANIFAPAAITASHALESGVVRERFVTFSAAPLLSSERVRLDLFPDLAIDAVRGRLERRDDGSFTWFGVPDGFPLGAVVLTVSDHQLAGSVLLPGNGNYQIVPRLDGKHRIRQVDEAALGGCGLDGVDAEELSPNLAGKSFVPPADPNFVPDDGSQIDLMVVYTPEANAASANIALEIQNAVDLANQSYVNSGIAMSLRLVHTAETSSGDSGNSYNDLIRLYSPSDGFMDEIHGLRNAHCADLVSLITESGTACGIAFMMENVTSSFEYVAFSAVKRNCLTGGVVLAHEIGHNMAGRHDWAMDSTNFAPYTYNHGYVCTCNAWHDILAYGNACGGCGAILYHSNPDLTYLGDPLGVPEGSFQAADLRKTFNNTKLTVSNFRTGSACRVLTLDTPSRVLADSPDGNADAIADAGENLIMTVNLHNNESFSVTSLTGVLSTSTPGITILDNTAFWPTLAADATAPSTTPHFAFAVGSSVPCGTSITFNLAATADQGTWNGSFQVVTGCNPWCNDPVFAGASSAADLTVCSDTGVQVSWSPAIWGAAPLGYEVRRYADAGCSTGETVLATGLMTTAYTDNTSTNAVNYWYKVYASNDCGRTSNGGACTGPARDDLTSLTGYGWASPNPVVEGTPQTFNSYVTGGSPPYTYIWDFTNNGTTDATTATANFTYPAGAYYNCRFRVTDSIGCYRENVFQVTVNTPPFNNCAQNISNSVGYDDTPRVHQGQVVWDKQVSSTNYEVYRWDGLSTQLIVSNGLQNRNVSISNGRLAWETFHSPNISTSLEIYTWKDGVTTRLTNNSQLDQNPIMQNGQIVWEATNGFSPAVGFFDGTSVQFLDTQGQFQGGTSLHNGKISWRRFVGGARQVLYWNGTSIQQITNAPYLKETTSNYNGKIAWMQKLEADAPPYYPPYQIFYWNGSTVPTIAANITQLTNTAGDNTALRLTGDNLAFWIGYDGNDWEVYRWDGTTITQLTNNSTADGRYPNPNPNQGNIYFDADGDTAVWTYWDGNDTEIYMWDGTSVRALTNNITSDIAPEISDKQVTWMQANGGNSYDIMYWQEARFDVTNLRLTGSATNFSWDHAPCAAPPSYRVIRGNLANLSVVSGQVNLGPVTCEVTATPTNAATIAGVPPVGTCWFYLVKEAAATDYGKSTAYQPELPSSEDCL